MILDRLYTFSLDQDLSQVVGAYDSTDIVDLGVSSGIPSSANGGGARDMGIGDNPELKLAIYVQEAFASGGAATLSVALQGAPDNGSGVPGSFTTMWTSPTFALATLAIAGQELANVDLPRPVAGQPMPRFLKLVYTIAGATTTLGTVDSHIVIDRFDQPVGTSHNLSGYPAGLNVAN